MNARLTIITLFIYISIAMIIFIAMKNSSDDRVLASVYPRELIVGDVLFYADSTSYAKSYVWDFESQGNKSFRAKGTYKYKMPGQYTIRLSINDKVVDQFPIVVKAPVAVHKKTTAITIYAVSEAIAGQNVHFKILGSDDIETCEWYFGETGKVGSHDVEAFNTYYTPGSYKVKLISNLSPEPVYHTILIKPAYTLAKKVVIAEPPAGGGGAGAGIKEYLQKIANGGSVSTNYKEMVSKFLCKDTPVTAVANGGAGTDFYVYCQNLRLNSGIKIESVATESDPKTNCITKLTITQH